MRKILTSLFLMGTLLLGATGCFDVELAPYGTQSNDVQYYPPGDDNTTDWVWVAVPQEWAYELMSNTGASLIEVQVCFQSAPTIYGRPYLHSIQNNTYYYSNTTGSNCTMWLTAAQNTYNGVVSMGWLKMAVFSPGENVTVQLRINYNSRGDATPMGVAGRVANSDPALGGFSSIVWYDF